MSYGRSAACGTGLKPMLVDHGMLAHLAAGARWLRVLDAARDRARGVDLMTEPLAPFDPLQLLRLLHDHHVRCVLIGGVAMRLYDERRLTDDLDVCFARDRDNCLRLADVLALVHARRRGWPAELPDLLDASALLLGGTFTLATDFGPLDLLGEPPGTRGYSDLASSATPIELDGLPVLIASREAMLRMKRAAGRPVDQADILILEDTQ